MKILNIKLCNYGSYVGEHFISLVDRGLVLIQGINKDETKMDSNGAGKSCIPDSLDWCINGKIPRGDHVDSIINDGCSNCYVEVQIESDNGDMILIERKKSRGGSTALRLLINDDNISKLDISETQKDIYQILGIDKEIFHSTILFAQTDLVHYADSTDSKRMEILTKLLQLEFIDNLLDKAKQKQNELLSFEQNILGKKQTIEGVLESLKNKDYTSLIEEWNDIHQRSLNALRSKEEEFIKRFDAIEILGKAVYEKKIRELKNQLDNLSIPDESVYKSYLNQQINNNKVLAVLNKEIMDISNKQQYLNNRLSSGNYYCDSCGQLVTVEHLQNEYFKNEELLNTKTSQYHIAKNELGVIEQEINKESNRLANLKNLYMDQRIKINADIQIQLNYITEIDKAISAKNLLQQDIVSIQKNIEEENNKTNPWIEVQRDAVNNIQDKTNELVGISQQLNSVYSLKECYSFWVKALSAKGLKSYILDTKLKELNDSINYWVRMLTDGTIWVELGSYKKGRNKKIINSPEVKVCRWSSDGSIITRNYKSWSGGEKQRISIAIDLGLSSIISRRSTKKYNVLILDEIFRHLDSGGKYSVMEMLQSLAKDKDSVFVIDHDPDFQSLFENRITVIKENGSSSIVEDNNCEDKRHTKETNNIVPSRAYFRRKAIRHPI
jgi:DNA repair exonuclease SbcCD ATPase subunit